MQILSKLDIDEQIPVELYKAVAEILAFVYSANNRYRGASGPKSRPVMMPYREIMEKYSGTFYRDLHLSETPFPANILIV